MAKEKAMMEERNEEIMSHNSRSIHTAAFSEEEDDQLERLKRLMEFVQELKDEEDRNRDSLDKEINRLGQKLKEPRLEPPPRMGQKVRVDRNSPEIIGYNGRQQGHMAGRRRAPRRTQNQEDKFAQSCKKRTIQKLPQIGAQISPANMVSNYQKGRRPISGSKMMKRKIREKGAGKVDPILPEVIPAECVSVKTHGINCPDYNSRLPIVEGWINQVSVKLLIDTGAMVSLIEGEYLRNISGWKNFKAYPSVIQVRGISGSYIPVSECREVILKMGSSEFDFPFIVTEKGLGKDYQAIIGFDFLTKHGINLMISEKQIRGKGFCAPLMEDGKGPRKTREDAETMDPQSPEVDVVGGRLIHQKKKGNEDIGKLQEKGRKHPLENQPLRKNEAKVRPSGGRTYPIYGQAVRKEKIPPCSETVIQARINCVSKIDGDVLFIPYEGTSPRNFAIGCTIGRVDKDQKLWVKVMNLNNFPVDINKRMRLGYVEPLTNEAEVNCTQVTKEGGFPIEDFQLEHLEDCERTKLKQLLERYRHVFARSVKELGSCDTLLHKVHLQDRQPVRQRPYRVPYALKDELNRQVEELLDAGIISHSKSSYAAPVVLVKKADGSFRLCTDFRQLNQKTFSDPFPIPNLSDLIDTLAGAKYYSCLDLTTGFYQMKLDPKDTYKTAFVTENGHYEWNRVPFGLKNSPNSFQRLMEAVLAGLRPQQIGIYIDDIVIASKSFNEHLERLELVFKRLEENHLKLKPQKCHFLKKSIKYLGHKVSQEGITPDQANVETVSRFKVPTCVKNVRAFLGVTGFYRKFIPNYAKKALPLTDLLKGTGRKFVWTKEAQEAFEILRNDLIKEPCLRLPLMDKPFILNTDASMHAIGAVLQQEYEDGKRHPVAYLSRKLKPAEINYSVVEKEALAVVHAVGSFRQYLYGRKFTVITDQASLSYMLKLKDPSSRIARWCLALQQYDFEVVHRPGRSNVTADYLSRMVNSTKEERRAKFIADIPIETFQEIQRNDPRLKRVIDAVEGRTVKKVPDEYFLDKGILMHYIIPKSGDTRSRPLEQVVVPEILVKHIMELCHECKVSRHEGFYRTLIRVRSTYFWPNMYAHIKNYVESCENCLARRGYDPRKKAPLLRASITSRPLERIAMDVIGPLTLSQNGNKYILLICDFFTRWPEAYALPDVKSETIAKVLVESFIPTHGLPEKILTDKGSNFISELMMKIYAMLGIKKQTTSSYHPQADGMVERANRTLIQILGHLVEETQHEWDEYLPFALLSMRTAVSASTKETPAYLMYGRDLILPYNLIQEETKRSYVDTADYQEDMVFRMNRAHSIVKKNLEKAAGLQEHRRKRHAVDKNIRLGDLVFLYTPQVRKGKCKKFTRTHDGPYRVIRQTSDVNFEVEKVRKPKEKRLVHVDRLTKQKSRRPFLHWEPDEIPKEDQPEKKPSHTPEELESGETDDEYFEVPDITVHTRRNNDPASSVRNEEEEPREDRPTASHGYFLRPRDGAGFVCKP